MGLPWSYPSDMWGVGCIIMEMYLGDMLLATHETIEHLALIEKIIGPFPKQMIKSIDRKYFDKVYRALNSDREGKLLVDKLKHDSRQFVSQQKPLEVNLHDFKVFISSKS